MFTPLVLLLRDLARSGFGRKRSRGALRLVALLLIAGLGTGAAAQGLILTEFMAANNSGLKDEDGDYSDWIEIYNPDPEPASLNGWYLTDNPDNLTKWPFPAVVVPGQAFLVVFASEKDRRDPLGPLHTNFKLDREGEYLALIRPDGWSVASGYVPTFPRQLSDVSYGVAMTAATEWLVPPESWARVYVPYDSQLGQTWIQPDFMDADWTTLPLGLGYDRLPGPDDPVEPSATLADVTQPDDFIVPTSSNSPGNEGVGNAIDNNSATKYLNFDKLNAGLTVTPAVGPTAVTGLRLTSANDAPDRDPTSYLLLGSNNGQTFVEVARGSIPDFSGRFVTVEVSFANRQAYAHYRLLFPTVRDAAAAVAMQIAEVEFLGQVGPVAPEFPSLIRTDVEGPMFGLASSAYLRLPFTVPEVPTGKQLVLGIRYDDGFVAWLNGVEVARANAPQALAYDAVASTNRFRTAAVQEARFNLSSHWDLLHPGTNVLALQALNDRAASADFLIQIQLESSFKDQRGNQEHQD